MKTTLCTLVALGLMAPAALANPFDYFGFTPRGVGMGSAMTALADDVSANYYNPAGLVARDALQLQLGYAYTSPSLEINGQDLNVDAMRGLQGGLVLPGSIGKHRIAVGLGLHIPDERVTRLRALPEAQPRFALYDNHPQRLVLTTSVSAELIPDILSLGLGLTYLSDTQGRLEMEGAVDFTDADRTTLISGMDVNFAAVRYLSAGLLFRPHERVRIGLAYRDEFDLTLDIGVRVQGDVISHDLGGADGPIVLAPDALLEVASRNANLFSPRQLTFGVAWTGPEVRPGERPCFSLSAEIGWYQWSRMKSPTAYLTTIIDIPNLPLDVPPNPEPSAPNFSDIWIPRVGYEQMLVASQHVDLYGRLGAWYEASPAPAQTGRTNFVDNAKMGLGFGLSLGLREFSDIFPKPIWIDVSGSWITMFEREHRKSDPSNPTGDYLSDGQFFSISTSLRMEF